MEVNAYVMFDGRCEEAFRFYERCLRGKLQGIMKFGESPMAAKTAPEWKDKVVHARLDVGETVLMGSDAPPEHYQKPAGISVAIAVKGAAEAERVFAELAEGGQVQMPIQKTYWAVRFGMLVDRFSVPWMVNAEEDA